MGNTSTAKQTYCQGLPLYVDPGRPGSVVVNGTLCPAIDPHFSDGKGLGWAIIPGPENRIPPSTLPIYRMSTQQDNLDHQYWVVMPARKRAGGLALRLLKTAPTYKAAESWRKAEAKRLDTFRLHRSMRVFAKSELSGDIHITNPGLNTGEW